MGYSPGPGRLRVFVITDGEDTHSSPPYKGMQGMNPMMHDLRKAGYNVEFHIVFVSGIVGEMLSKVFQSTFGGSITQSDLGQYRDLALGTGGSFLHLDGNE